MLSLRLQLYASIISRQPDKCIPVIKLFYFLKENYTWPLNNMRIRDADSRHSGKPCIILQLILCIWGSVSTNSINLQIMWFYSVFNEKSVYKRTYTVTVFFKGQLYSESIWSRSYLYCRAMDIFENSIKSIRQPEK